MKKTLFLISVLILIGGLALFVNERKYIVVKYADLNNVSSSRSSSTESLQLPVDPYLCKDNPEGYVYFKFGEEIFRYTKNSTIKVVSMMPALKSPAINSDIPEGCEGNPYTGVVLKYEYQEGSNPLWKINLKKFWLDSIPPERYGTISPGQELREHSYYRRKENNGLCDAVTENLFRCAIRHDNPDIPRDEWAVSYLSDNSAYSTAVGRPFALDCTSNVVDLLCEAYYRLYPSVDFKYAYYSKEIKPENILLFDQYLRQLFEEMRVKH